MKICKYAIPKEEFKKQTGHEYPYPYKCGVFYECRYTEPSEEKTVYCPRKEIGDNEKVTAESVLYSMF